MLIKFSPLQKLRPWWSHRDDQPCMLFPLQPTISRFHLDPGVKVEVLWPIKKNSSCPFVVIWVLLRGNSSHIKMLIKYCAQQDAKSCVGCCTSCSLYMSEKVHEVWIEGWVVFIATFHCLFEYLKPLSVMGELVVCVWLHPFPWADETFLTIRDLLWSNSLRSS